jgi:hypothetical protein
MANGGRSVISKRDRVFLVFGPYFQRFLLNLLPLPCRETSKNARKNRGENHIKNQGALKKKIKKATYDLPTFFDFCRDFRFDF